MRDEGGGKSRITQGLLHGRAGWQTAQHSTAYHLTASTLMPTLALLLAKKAGQGQSAPAPHSTQSPSEHAQALHMCRNMPNALPLWKPVS